MQDNKLVIGSRGSRLALWQTNHVEARLHELFPQLEIEIRTIKTTGDKLLDVALAKIGDKGLFTKQIETELLDGGIDAAVHSLKDLQTQQPEGLTIGAVLARETPNDVLISKRYRSIEEMPQGAKVATGSLRRRSQLLHFRPDLEIFEIRGNVPTRIEKFGESGLDGMILAYAGVHRLGLDEHISQVIPFDVMLPAVSQGAMAVEIRTDDAKTAEIIRALNHDDTEVCVTAERRFLRELEGGCQVPIAANARLEGDRLSLSGMVGSLDGKTNLRDETDGPRDEADEIGRSLAEKLKERGAGELLDDVRKNSEEIGEPVF